jgi:hypothetical protein
MISLIDLILEKDVEEMSVWRTYSRQWGARNTFGEKRYFKDQEDATNFARGTKTTKKDGKQNKLVKLKAKRMERSKKYDTTPVVKKDAEKTS